MVQSQNIVRHNASASPVFTGLNNHTKVLPGLRRGFSHIFSLPDFIEVIQRGGNYVITGKKQAVNQPCKMRQSACNVMAKRWSMIEGLANPSEVSFS